MDAAPDSAAKFDASRADDYAEQSRIALSGYDACHELAACLLAASLGGGAAANILVAGGGGTGNEVIATAGLMPASRFFVVDPSQPMLDLAVGRIAAAGFAEHTRAICGAVEQLRPEDRFDAATLIGVLHHVAGDAAKAQLLQHVADRLKPGAPFVLACNHYAYAERPLLLRAWGEKWRMKGATPAEVDTRLGKILEGADPPTSEEAVLKLLAAAGFIAPQRFFSSLFWGAWIARRQ